MEPVLKRAGGKRKFASNIINLIGIKEPNTHRLFALFFGGPLPRQIPERVEAHASVEFLLVDSVGLLDLPVVF